MRELQVYQGFSTEGAGEVQGSVLSESYSARQVQEVQAAIVIAKRFPRDMNTAFNRIMQSCKRKTLAESAMYEYPRGNTRVEGASIRLAEAIAQNWGNIDYGITELEQRNGESTVMAYAWDLETNVRQIKVFTVKHERKSRGSTTKLDDSRDIYEMVANQGARRLRACILGIIPGDIVEAAVEECKKTLQGAYKDPLADRVRKMIAVFDSEYQVAQEMLESYIGYKADAFSENDFIRLKNIYKALRDGIAKREDYFEVQPISKTEKKSKSSVLKELQEQEQK